MNNHPQLNGNLIALVDNRPMFRDGIKKALNALSPNYQVYECASVDELHWTSSNEQTNYFFIRVGNIPYNLIINSIRKIRLLYQSSKIILYDYQGSVNYIISFFGENINAYMADEFDFDELNECMLSIASGKVFITTTLALDLLQVKPLWHAPTKVWLTPTELKVAKMLVKGMKPSVIARKMNRKISTISTVKSNIFKKTKVNNIIDLVGAIHHMPVGYRI